MTWPEGSSEMAARVREHAWAETPLGPLEGWPEYLRSTVDLLLQHPLPMALFWGDDLIQIYNDQFAGMIGKRHPIALGRPQLEIWPALSVANQALIERLRAGEPVLIEEVQYRHAASGKMEDHWYMIAYSPVHGDQGSIAGILITVLETTKHKKAEHRLRQGEERHAFLLRLNDAVRPLADPVEVQRTAMRMVNDRLGAGRAHYIQLAPDGDTILSREGIDLFASRPANAYPDRISDFGAWVREEFACRRPVVIEDSEKDPRINGDAREAFRGINTRAATGLPLHKQGKPVALIIIEFEQPRQRSEEELALLADVAERVWDAVERTRAEWALRHNEERLRIMVAELQHRVRNILTVVRSVFTRTMEGGGEAGDLADHFRGRLDALARTQVIVTQTATGTADLENLIRDELISVGVCDGPDVTIEGPDVLLDSRVAESIGLAIHELTTNALKYGALKVDGGRLDIRWSLRPVGGDTCLDLDWEEQGVPAVALRPLRQGYGRELIEQALPYRLRAQTSLNFRGGGIRCSISVPLGATAANG